MRAPGTPGVGMPTKDKMGRMRSAPYDTTQRRRTAAPTTPGALPGDTMLAELVNGDHWRIGKDVAIRVHAEPRQREYNMVADGDLPGGFQDSGLATLRKTFRNGNVKTNETVTWRKQTLGPVSLFFEGHKILSNAFAPWIWNWTWSC